MSALLTRLVVRGAPRGPLGGAVRAGRRRDRVYHRVQWGLFGEPVAMAFTRVVTGSAHVLFTAAFLRSGTR